MTEATEQPFRITGPGVYLTRAKDSVEITQMKDGSRYWESARWCYFSNGRVNSYNESHADIIAGPIPGEPASQEESAGLTGFLCRADNYRWHQYDGRQVISGNSPQIDLSKVPASAIVKPEPKTVSGWINIYKDDQTGLPYGTSCLYPERHEVENLSTQGRIACIRVEFTEGEVL